MFTGLVVERGRILEVCSNQQAGSLQLQLEVSSELADRLLVGASLAVAGCCLTLTSLQTARHRESASVEVELSAETIARTTLGAAQPGDLVNLEPALELGQPLGGHWVQGHIDGTVELVRREDDRQFSTLSWAKPKGLESSIVEKGSVTIDGTSLTVAALEADCFSVALIPHTLEHTTLGSLTVGENSNIEVDILSKYVDQALAARLEAIESSLRR